MTSNSGTSVFLALPKEIRIRIFEHLLRSTTTRLPTAALSGRQESVLYAMPTSLLQVIQVAIDPISNLSIFIQPSHAIQLFFHFSLNSHHTDPPRPHLQISISPFSDFMLTICDRGHRIKMDAPTPNPNDMVTPPSAQPQPISQDGQSGHSATSPSDPGTEDQSGAHAESASTTVKPAPKSGKKKVAQGARALAGISAPKQRDVQSVQVPVAADEAGASAAVPNDEDDYDKPTKGNNPPISKAIAALFRKNDS
jgi:hypothetical protein